MTKSRITVTDEWQEVAAGEVVITVATHGTGTLYINEEEEDDTAYKGTPGNNEQFEQTSTVPTYVKATGDGWELVVDGALV